MDMDELGARPMTYREKLLSIGTVDLCGLVDLDRAEQLAIDADAEIAGLRADAKRIDAQWRDELRIYREAEDARIAELVDLLTECRDCVASDINHTLAQFHEPAAVDYLHALLMRVDAAMAARANGGES